MSDSPEVSGDRSLRRRFGRPRLATVRDYGIIAIFVALFLVLTFASSAFLSKTNLLNILDQSAPIGIIACGMTLVLIAGGFDLSAWSHLCLGWHRGCNRDESHRSCARPDHRSRVRPCTGYRERRFRG